MKRSVFLLMCLLAALLLAACGGTTTPATTDSEPAVEAPAEGGEAAEEAAEEPAEGEAMEGEEMAVGDAANGETLFKGPVVEGTSAPGCATCHSLEPGQQLVGPSMAGVASRAGERVPGQSAQEYLHQSIVAPNEHVVEGFAPGLMYQNYEQDLSEEQINDLVAYLLTLE